VGAAGRACETAGALAGAAVSFVPFLAGVAASLLRPESSRRRDAALLREWSPAPGPAPEPAGRSGGRLLVLAGEPSGDRLAADALAALLRRRPGVEARGFGGARLAAAGARLDEDLAGDAVMGVAAVLARAPRFIGLHARWLKLLDDFRPDAVLVVDYPGFNLRAAEAARRRGIPVAWYAVPQVWAWAPWRARRFGRAATRLLGVLPFEPAFYAARGVECRFVGYPVFEHLAAAAPDTAIRASLRSEGGEILALLPGSRGHEVRDNLPDLLAAAAIAGKARSSLRPVVACAAPRLRAAVDAAIRSSGSSARVIDGNVGALLAESRAALAVSGTVTMECAHALVPTAVAYRTSALGRRLMSRVVTTPWICLPNILAGEELFPEFVGPAGPSRASSLANALGALAAEGEPRRRAIESLARLRARIPSEGTAARVAAELDELMG
jgi:lipid-A-disaccharide synthase